MDIFCIHYTSQITRSIDNYKRTSWQADSRSVTGGWQGDDRQIAGGEQVDDRQAAGKQHRKRTLNYQVSAHCANIVSISLVHE